MTKDDMMRLTSAYNADILLSHLNYLRQSKARHVYSCCFNSMSAFYCARHQFKSMKACWYFYKVIFFCRLTKKKKKKVKSSLFLSVKLISCEVTW